MRITQRTYVRTLMLFVLVIRRGKTIFLTYSKLLKISVFERIEYTLFIRIPYERHTLDTLVIRLTPNTLEVRYSYVRRTLSIRYSYVC